MLKFKNINYFNERYCYIYIFFFALAIRIFIIILIPPEFWEYEQIANNILSGKGFTYLHMGTIYRSYCEPLYPFFNAIIYFLTHHNVMMLEFAQAIFSSAIAVVIYFCAKNFYGRSVACLASALVALHPGLIIYTTKLHPLTLDALFFSLVLLATIKLSSKISRGNIIIMALISGLCVLSRPTILIFLPLALIYIFKIKKIPFTKSIYYAIIFSIFAAIIFLPWSLRNYFIHKQFMLTRSNAPFVFWLGNNPNFSGSALDIKGEPVFALAPAAFKEKIYGLNEAAQNKEFLTVAVKYIHEHPLRFIGRTIKKFYYFWWFSPQAGLLYDKIWFILYKILYIFIVSAGLIGIYSTYQEGLFRAKPDIALILLILLTISFTQSLFYIEGRHRWAVEPIFLIFTAKGLQMFFSKYMPRISKFYKKED